MEENLEENNVVLSGDIFNQAELGLNLKIPAVIKNNLRINGYEDISVIAQINEDKILEIETFAQTDLKDIIEEPTYVEYFGVFAKNPAKFKFLGGHKQILNMLISFCKTNISKANTSCKQGYRSKTNVKMSKSVNNADNLDSTNSESNLGISDSESVNSAINLTKENALILRNIKSWVKGKVSTLEWNDLSLKFDNVQVITRVADEDNLYCNVTCFCGACYKLPKVSRKGNLSAPRRWVLSNFQTHLQKKHINSRDSLGVNLDESSNAKSEKRAETNVITSYFFKPKVNSETLERNKKNTSIRILGNIKLPKPFINAPMLGVTQAVTSDQGGSCSNSSQSTAKDSLPDIPTPSPTPMESYDLLPDVPSPMNDYEFQNMQSSPSTSYEAAYEPHSFSPLPSSESSQFPLKLQMSQSEPISSKWKTLKYQRTERARRAREKSTDIKNQELITKYFHFIDKICDSVTDQFAETLISKLNIDNNQDNLNNFDNSETDELPQKYENNKQYLSTFLQKLVSNAIQNSKSSDNRNLFDQLTKKISVYLFYTAGRLSYETLYSNLKNSLPSISTVNRFVEDNRTSLKEGDIDFSGLHAFLDQRNLPKIVWISEDGTRINGKIEYDPTSNKVVGFVMPLQNGLPDQNKFIATSSTSIQEYFQTATKASYAYVMVAQPLVAEAPSYCLGVFGTDNRFTFKDVQKRWIQMKEQAQRYGISILGFASDGDTRLLKAMRVNTNLNFYRERSLNANKSWRWYHIDIEENDDVSECYFQDFTHILTKLRVRLIGNTHLKIGDKIASVEHLFQLIRYVPKDKHLLTESDLRGDDKMNFRAAEKMCSLMVIECLRKMPETEGTVIYLTIMSNILSCFLSNNLTIGERVYKIWFVVFLLRIWKSSIRKNSTQTLKDDFLSSNCYTCIELNAHTLIKLILLFKFRPFESIEPNMFYLPNMSSQPCEKLFRTARSMTSTYSTIINFSMKDLTHRVGRIRTINSIISDIKSEFSFPREEKISTTSRSVLTNENFINLDVESTVLKALEDVLLKASQIGLLGIEADDYLNLDISPLRGIHEDETNVDNEVDLDETLDDTEDISENIIQAREDDAEKDNDYGLPELLSDNDSDHHQFESLELKEYSHITNGNIPVDSPYVEVKLKNKTAIIKKSSLCWLLDQSNGRVSTDRLRRFISNTKVNNKKTLHVQEPPTKKIKKCNRKSNAEAKKLSSESTSEVSDYDDDDSDDVEIENSPPSNSSETSPSSSLLCAVKIELEKYYAVAYDKQWYIGRVTAKINKDNFKMKFLKEELRKFVWPRSEDTDTVNKKFIFHGPVHLLGSGPFNIDVNEYMIINKKYKISI